MPRTVVGKSIRGRWAPSGAGFSMLPVAGRAAPGVGIELIVDKSSLRKAQAMLRGVPRGVERALRSAINKTAVFVRDELARELMDALGTKGRRIRRELKLKRASLRSLMATVTIKRENVPIYALAARRIKTGVAYWIGGKRRTIEHAFIAKMKSGHRGVFLRVELVRRGHLEQRRPRARKAPGVFPDLPIKELFGPRLTKIFETRPGLRPRIMASANRRLRMEVDREVERSFHMLARRGSK